MRGCDAVDLGADRDNVLSGGMQDDRLGGVAEFSDKIVGISAVV